MATADPYVFIFESPRPDEIANGIGEGKELADILDQMKIQNQFFQPASLAELRECFERVLDAVQPMKGRPLVWPLFYFSAHGNQQGFGLTNGEFCSWDETRKMLLATADRNELYDEHRRYAAIYLCLSTCEGAFARELFALDEPYPCIAVVGPETKLGWTKPRGLTNTSSVTSCGRRWELTKQLSP